MRKAIVAGNWKMHGSKAFVADYASALIVALQEIAIPDAVAVVVFPPLAYLSELAAASAQADWTLGAQNLHPEVSGAYTGEVAAEMIRDLGASWVLAGHSERREYAAESAELVAQKYAAALRAGLTPIVCVGETEAQRDAGQAEDVVRAQLAPVFDLVGADGMLAGAVAYEPVWAIGTGKTATAQVAQTMHEVIRGELANLAAEVAQTVPVAYGGSVKAANAAELFAQPDIDGALVGGASLDAAEFAAIVAAASAAVAN